MTYYGIFNQDDNYRLLRYSNAPQDGRTYQVFDYPTKTYSNVVEICLPDIEYSPDNIGKFYDLESQSFYE
jgi:hypothetical protein